MKGKKYHRAALEAATAFTAAMENPEVVVDRRLSSEKSKCAAENQIAETVTFCGRQGLVFRGHRDDTPTVREDSDANHGNFLALLHFRIQAAQTACENSI